MKSKSISRRGFIEKAALTAGLTAFGVGNSVGKPVELPVTKTGLPREVWIAAVSKQGINAGTPEKTAKLTLAILEKSTIYHPDVICLPEVFMNNRLEPGVDLRKEAELSAELLNDFIVFARTNQCYMICPILTHENGKTYNAAVVIDRQGNRIGEYRKMYLPDDEIKIGLTPGDLQPKVFKADFGVFGIQICYDINWDIGWKSLRQQGAEIVFWPSAFSGGQMVNTKAWENKYVVVSSTGAKSRICDISGEVVAQTGMWDTNLICAPVNLEKVFLHAWPFGQRFDEIKAKYGRKIKITNYTEEEWSVIESLSPEIRVKNILKEFDLRTFEQLIHDSETLNSKKNTVTLPHK